jgi:hypothetical protein
MMTLLSRITGPADLKRRPDRPGPGRCRRGHLRGHLLPATSVLPHASRDQILQAHGLDASGITAAVLKRPASTPKGKVPAKEMR